MFNLMSDKKIIIDNFIDYGFINYTHIDYDELRKVRDKDNLSDNARFILESRYLLDRYDIKYETIVKERTYFEVCRRVARMIACAETLYTDDIERIRLIENNIFMDLFDRRFIFNSPALFNLGIDLITDKFASSLIYDNDDINYHEYKYLYDNRSDFQMCFACFVIPIDDSLRSIYDSVKNAAIISMKGGGVGANFGRTREKGGLIRNGQGGVSSGPISWMRQWNTMAEEVVQGGKRRAALMGMIDINHPDIEQFISCKDENNILSYFNISVAISDLFMNAVLNNEDFELISRVDKKYNKKVNARELWTKICEHAWKKGDPGIHFIDKSNQDSLLKMNRGWIIEATNPCGEMNLPYGVNDENYKSLSISDIGCEPKWYKDGSSDNDSENGNCCNLGSINLMAFTNIYSDNRLFDFNSFNSQIKRSIYYLDLIIDASAYPLEGIERNTKKIRPVGLGIMGIHDLGIALNMPFLTSKKTDSFAMLCNDIAKYLGIKSLEASIEIVTKLNKQPFSENECVKDLFKTYLSKYDLSPDDTISVIANGISKAIHDDNDDKLLPISIKSTLSALNLLNTTTYRNILRALINGDIRNSRRLSIAPNGSISLLCDVSSGIEPNFAFKWNRKVRVQDGKGGTNIENREYIHYLVPDELKDELEKNGYISNNDIFKGALEIDPSDHLGIVSIFSKYVDASISKTINLPEDATVNDIVQIYTNAYLNNIKGITIYRNNSRNDQPITAVTKESEIKKDIIVKDVQSYRPMKGTGSFIQIKAPYGNIHLSAKFNDHDEMCEVFITLNKSGQELKAITEALSRLISIALQESRDHATVYRRLIKTLKGIAGFEAFVYDSEINNREYICRSIPDLIAYVLPDLEYIYLLDKYGAPEVALNRMIAAIDVQRQYTQEDEMNNISETQFIEKFNKHKSLICPECGGTNFYKSEGCDRCLTCGYSKCSVG